MRRPPVRQRDSLLRPGPSGAHVGRASTSSGRTGAYRRHVVLELTHPPAARILPPAMLHYFKFRQDLFGPQPAKEVYRKPGKGKGWPEECPPIRAANAFGFDLMANFDVTFVRARGAGGDWRVKDDIVIESDFDWAANEDAEGKPLAQQYAWFWQKGQTLPHVISDNV